MIKLKITIIIIIVIISIVIAHFKTCNQVSPIAQQLYKITLLLKPRVISERNIILISESFYVL